MREGTLGSNELSEWPRESPQTCGVSIYTPHTKTSRYSPFFVKTAHWRTVRLTHGGLSAIANGYCFKQSNVSESTVTVLADRPPLAGPDRPPLS